ncbi:MAG TPA: hypothetical protein VFZ00_02985 [Solirubrobacter sp.]|nr:hypothetical protein [Solirubrobacter sp.]
MTVAASILLAALVGGIVFVMIDSWQRRAEAAPESPTEPLPYWSSESRTEPLPDWSREPRTEPLWNPPPSPRRWDERDDDQDDPPPPGLWSGWAR